MSTEESKTVKKLVIVGNGLDLHHGIRSKYKQFYNHISFPRDLREIYSVLTGSLYPAERWYDFEEEYRALIKTETALVEKGYGSRKTGFTDENTMLYMPRIKLINYVFQRINSEFVNYLKDEYEAAKDDSVNRCFKKDKNVLSVLADADAIINFNYTNTLEDLYEINRDKIVHIHGTLEGDNAIIGHSNFCDFDDPNGPRYGYRINYPELRNSTYLGDKNLQRLEHWNETKIQDASFADLDQVINTQIGTFTMRTVQNNSPISVDMLQKIYENPFDTFEDEKNGYCYCNKLAFVFEEPLEITIIGHGLGSDQDLLVKIPVQNKKVCLFQQKNKRDDTLNNKAKEIFRCEVFEKQYSNE